MSSRDHPDWWKNVGGQNSQDSLLERRSLVWNDDAVVDRTLYPILASDEAYRGKFFTRGCRGKIEALQMFCRRTGILPTIILRFSAHPCIGPFHTVTIIPGAPWAWVGAAFEEMWNYDSLFIWVHSVTNAEWGYDAAEPYDGHESADAGATWADTATRPFIRVVYTGETPGDVPVSGTVNVIEIPSIASQAAADLIPAVASAAWTTICTAEGAGTMFEAKLELYTSVAPTPGAAPPAVRYQLQLLADGGVAELTDNRDLTQSCVATSGRSSKGEFYQCTVADPAWDRTVMTVRLPLKFRRSLVLRARHTTGVAVTVEGGIFANMIR